MRRSGPAAALRLAVAGVLLTACGSAVAPPPADIPVADRTDPTGPAADATLGPAQADPGDGAVAPTAGADDPVPAVQLVEVARLDAPIDAVATPDGALLIATREGRVVVAEAGTDGPAAGTVLVDVSDRTTTDGERGLLGLDVTPTGDELVLSLTDAAGDTLVEAHPLAGSRVTGPPRTLYAVAQPFANHNGGDVAFGPDGTLLLGLGDGGGGGDPLGAGQDVGTPLGAIVRLDVSGGTVRVPADNPFVGRLDAAPEIVAFGLRNPWRLHVDPPTGTVWIADVGQGDVEEINRIGWEDLPGANLGWALREGDAAFDGPEPRDHVAPVHTYRHGPGCSVTGGVVVRDPALPDLAGGYVFADLCDGTLRVLRPDAAGALVAAPLDVAGDRVVGFATDADGRVVVLDLAGRVLRLTPA